MISISVYYPRQAGKRFDQDYYLNQHMPRVREKLAPHGMTAARADLGISGMNNTPAPFFAVGHMVFPDQNSWREAFHAVGQELIADIPNYTDVQPLLQISHHYDT